MMTWMNTYDIDDAYNELAEHTVFGPAVLILSKLRDAVNGCSDGWAYWRKPHEAASQLMALVESARRSRMARRDTTIEQIKAAVEPIKAFIRECEQDERMKSYPLELTVESLEIALGEKSERPVSAAIRKLAIEAYRMSGASNLMGLSLRYAHVLIELRTALKDDGRIASLDEVSNHPITRVWTDKLAQLAGVQGICDAAIEAHKQVAILAASPTQEAAASS